MKAFWCLGVVVKRAEVHSGCEFDSSMCHNKNTIGEEGDGKSRHKIRNSRNN